MIGSQAFAPGTTARQVRLWLRWRRLRGGPLEMTEERAVAVLRLAGRRVTEPRCLMPRQWQLGLRPFVTRRELVAAALRALPEIEQRWW
jgi:hypothetical protein